MHRRRPGDRGLHPGHRRGRRRLPDRGRERRPHLGLTTADVAAEVVLGNNVVVGTVNANKRHWYRAADALVRADRSWLERLITRRERPENFAKALHRQPDDIKVVIQFAQA